MEKHSKLMILMLALTAMLFTGCARVGPGYVGIKVNQAGSDRGVQDYPLQMGWVFYNPLTSDVYEYPTFKHTVTWDEDHSIQFNAKGGIRVVAPVSLSISFKAERVPHVFVTYRSDPDVIEQGYLKNQVRDAFNRAGNTFEPLELLTNQQALLDAAKKHLEETIGENFDIESVMLPKGLTMPENITNAINQVIEAQQKAQKAQAEVAEVEAQGRKTVAKAEADAKAVLIQAESQAAANRKLSDSITGTLVELRRVEKWDGRLPQVQSSATPFVNLSK
jgi:regulator of protease activity HflC (stomatin/prohibitin superfamily)